MGISLELKFKNSSGPASNLSLSKSIYKKIYSIAI
jgi:hypothetical protein